LFDKFYYFCSPHSSMYKFNFIHSWFFGSKPALTYSAHNELGCCTYKWSPKEINIKIKSIDILKTPRDTKKKYGTATTKWSLYWILSISIKYYQPLPFEVLKILNFQLWEWFLIEIWTYITITIVLLLKSKNFETNENTKNSFCYKLKKFFRKNIKKWCTYVLYIMNFTIHNSMFIIYYWFILR